MTNPNDIIFKVHASERPGEYSALTKREYFAAMAMTLFNGDIEEVSELSVKMSDALIAALNKKP